MTEHPIATMSGSNNFALVPAFAASAVATRLRRERNVIAVVLLAFGIAACASDSGFGAGASAPLPDAAPADAMRASVRAFPESVVLPAHEALVDAADTLVRTAAIYERAPNADVLAALRRARLDTAVALARGRAVAFGPIHSLGLDDALAFPTDPAGVDALLARLDGASVADIERLRLTPSLGGLETIEHVIAGADEGETPAALDPAARRYVHALARGVRRAAIDLRDVWREGHDGHPPFAATFATAGGPDNRAYHSVRAGAEEIVRGIADTLDVLAAEVLPGLLEPAAPLSGADASASLAPLAGAVTGAGLAWRGARIDGWLAAEGSTTGTSVPRLLDDASSALADAIAEADAEDADGARAALGRAVAPLEQALGVIGSEVMPLTRRPLPPRDS